MFFLFSFCLSTKRLSNCNLQATESRNIKENQKLRSRVCAQSKEPLRHPIVACEQGNLFNKEAIVVALINKTLSRAFSHIKGLKVKRLYGSFFLIAFNCV